MEWYKSIGDMIKWFIKCRNKTIRETADYLNIKYATFSAQLNHNTVSADILFQLAAYLDIDLNWMMVVLGYHGNVSLIEREMIPRMSEEFREIEWKKVVRRLDILIRENPVSTADTRRELLKEFSGNIFYLLDVLVPAEYNLFMISERGKIKFYVDIPGKSRGNQLSVMRRKPISMLYEGTKALDIAIEERKDEL